MRRKHLILASCIISALLLTFTFHVSADENVEADAGASSNSAPLLDSYFWDNYTLLPYIESDGQQYIDIGVKPSSDLTVRSKFSFVLDSSDYGNLLGCYDIGANLGYLVYYQYNDNNYRVYVGTTLNQLSIDASPYSIHDVQIDQKNVYFDGSLMGTIPSDYSIDLNIYLFGRNAGGQIGNMSRYRIYSFSVYDNSLSDPDYIRYYYPAKSKSGDVIGLYDAVSKTFVTTGSSTPFASPTDDQVIHFQIGDFIESGLGWIGDILEFAIEEPMILMFMAIGLCGVAFRWARRVVHF